jgi:2-polyprenyl-3-methyl-5-hydroxy-6-metoxy-1,4-benzoquinol methylase
MLSLYPLKSLFPDAGWGSRPENEAEAVSYLKAANAIGKWKDGEEVQKCIGQVTQRVSRQRAMELMEELGKEEMAKESEAFSKEDGEVKTGRGAKGDAYYDRIYEDSEQYHSDYKVSHYYEMWTQVLQLLRMVQEPRVLEIGCGTGQLAHYLYDEGFRHYHGFDFSEEAVRIASQRVPQSFCVADARAPETFDHNYNVVTCLEVLEHVDDDLGILSNIHEGAAVILSVPSSDDPAHVRFFLAKDSVTRRYSAVLDIQEIVQIDRWFVCLGVKLPAVD